MSVQLIVYPQNYEGQYNVMSTSTTEFLVNGINFNVLGSTGTYTSTVSPPYVDTLTNAPPLIANTWYRFRNNNGGTPDYPSVVSGSLILKSIVGTGSTAGVYQKLTNLVIGQQYTITINLSAATTGTIVTQIVNGTNIYSGGGGAANVTQITDTFTAQSTDSTVMIVYINTIVATATVTDISIQPVIGAVPSGAVQILGDGQAICDLYEDEDLPLTLSVDDFKNVAEKVQSYSKAFNLPSTKRNTKIFNAIFEITRSYDGVIFNPYRRTQCVLKQDGFILFEGYLRLLDVTDKEGEISYNVNLYSEVIAFADVLKDRAFRDLDFTELAHEYNRTQIVYSWNDGVTSGQTTPITWINSGASGFRTDFETLKYPFVDWNHQILIGGASGTAATSGNPEYTSLEQIFRPFINIKYLIDRIFEATEFTYESDFFSTTDFEKLFMDFNWGADNSPVTVNNIINGFYEITTATNFAPNGSFGNLALTSDFTQVDYNNTTNKFTATTNNVQYNISYDYQILVAITNSGYSARWLLTRAATGFTEEINLLPMQSTGGAGAVYNFSGIITTTLQIGDTLEAQFSSDTTNGIVQNYSGAGNVTANVTVQKSILSITTDVILQTLRGELGQWDFLKGLITMFNLVTLVDEDNPNNIIIEPYSDVFIPTATSGETLANRGIQHDWTDKIDVSEMKLRPLTDLNRKTIFKFVEDVEDFAFNVYKNLVGGHLYGSKKFNAGNEFNILEGLDEIVAEPFAATVVKPLMSQFPNFITPSIYSYNVEADTSEAFDNSPRIMYNNGIKSTGVSYYIPEQNGVTSDNQSDFLQFTHLSTVPSNSAALDFHFGECQLMTGVGTSTVNNLFNMYWLPYYTELYNPNTRIMTIKVNLSPADINTFNFNDRVYMKNRVFRVNKIDYKPNDLATVEFILIP